MRDRQHQAYFRGLSHCLIRFPLQLLELGEKCYTNLYGRSPTKGFPYMMGSLNGLYVALTLQEEWLQFLSSKLTKRQQCCRKKNSVLGLNLAEIPAYFTRHLLHSFRLLRNVCSSNAVGSVSYSVSILEENAGPVLYSFLPTALFFSSSFPRKEVCESWPEF